MQRQAIQDGGALVLLSGGQDSATCLAWALNRFDRVETVGFDYGQRHAVEMQCRKQVRDTIAALSPLWRERLGPDVVLDLSLLSAIGGTAMTEPVEIATTGRYPNTFVPGRNVLFLTAAAALAFRRGLRHIVTGVCETDYSGYPDCRDDTIKSLQVTLNLGMDSRFVIDTPLMWLDKGATWRLADELGGSALIDAILEETHTCYRGDRKVRHVWGYGCAACPACELRARGWASFVAERSGTDTHRQLP